jgi:phosphohistidine phosphatase
MKTLLLLRHGKSAWDDASLPDFDRPLTDRGQKAAPVVAAWLRRKGLIPDLVLLSAARRAVETWERAAPAFDQMIPVRTEHELYMAEPDRILEVIRARAGDANTVLVIGHNPGMEELARALTGDGKKKALRRMREKFPTAAVAVVNFDVANWAQVAPGEGELRVFVRPKDLDEAAAE